MSANLTALDTNILFYAADTTAGDRHLLAKEVLRAAKPRRCIVPLQTLGEFIHATSRKRPAALPAAREIALELSTSFSTPPPDPSDFLAAIACQQTHNLPFWDAMLWATVRRAGCTVLLTEDFQHGRTLDGVTFRNPFNLPAAELKELLA